MANRKTWIHGFFQNTFNAETGNWQQELEHGMTKLMKHKMLVIKLDSMI